MAHERDSLFKEVQFMRHSWFIRGLILFFSVIALIITISTLVSFLSGDGSDVGKYDYSKLIPIGITIVAYGGLILLMLTSYLSVDVRTDALYIRYFPFHLREQHFDYSQITYCEARTYRPLLEYGGWGIRYSHKGKAYNVMGNMGVQLEFENGKRLLIGSQKAKKLANAIQNKLDT